MKRNRREAEERPIRPLPEKGRKNSPGSKRYEEIVDGDEAGETFQKMKRK